jgi:hypothetical protein
VEKIIAGYYSASRVEERRTEGKKERIGASREKEKNRGRDEIVFRFLSKNFRRKESYMHEALNEVYL